MKTALCFLPGILVLALFWGIMAIVPQPPEKEINWQWTGWIDDPPERASGFPYPQTEEDDHPTRTRPPQSGMGVPPISPAP